MFVCLLTLCSMADNVVRVDVSHPSKTKCTDSLTITVGDSLITINDSHKSGHRQFVLTGKNPQTALLYKGCTKVSITADNLLVRQLFLNNKKHNTIVLPAKSVTQIVGGQDTLHRACVFASGNLTIKGNGTMLVSSTFDGMKGIYSKKNIHIKGNPTITINTSGNNLGVKPDMGPGFGPDGMDGFEPDSAFMAEHPHPDFGQMDHPEFPDSLRPEFPHFPDSLRPDFPEFPDSMGFGPMMGGGPMKQKYYNTTKGIKALGTVTIDGGNITVNTKTAGAEGIEGKKGVTLAGGTVNVDAQDDGINSGGKIVFAGADVKVISRGNDAVDSNSRENGAITISGGSVFACSLIGPPEEGLDSDESPIVITGGVVLSMGGSMGPDGSMPTKQSATQPYLLSRNIKVKKGSTVSIKNDNKVYYSATMPEDATFSNVLISAPEYSVLDIKY